MSESNITPPAAPTESRATLRAALLRWTGFALGVSLVLAVAMGFIVREGEHAVVLRFGKPVRVLSAAGWYGRAPWPIDRVVRLDARLQHGELRLSETLTRDKRNVIVPMYYVWRVDDAARYLARVGTASSAAEKLDAIVTSARNAELGRLTFDDLVSLRETGTALTRLERSIVTDAHADAAQNLGVELVDVGVLRINLPQANTESVFRRMRAERLTEAARYRAEGRSQAERIRAETDKEASGLLAEARRYAEETRGTAEAEAARIYAGAHGQDVAFYGYLRQLQSLRSVIDRNTTLILDTDAAPFSLLKTGPDGYSPNGNALPVLKPRVAGPGDHDSPPPVDGTVTSMLLGAPGEARP